MNIQTRRDFLRTCTTATLATLCLLPWLARATEPSGKPNIVLLMADDLGWGDTGYNGHPKIKTPVLDEMATEGVRFDRFYAAHPMCSPTRASVLTGRNNNRYRVYFPGYALPSDEVTLAQVLRKAGYVTGHFGNWHLGSVAPDAPSNPSAFGFDEWVSSINFYGVNPIMSRRGQAEQLHGEGSLVTINEANDFISRQAAAKRPFLAVVWFGAVHGPPKTTKEFADLYSGEPKEVAQYCGQTTAMDTAIGQLRAALDKAGVRENTLVWFCSDNGGSGSVTVTGGRGKKAGMYEGGLRVPGLIEWPAAFPKPIRTAMPASTCDIFPTCLEAAGIQPEVSNHARLIDGISLLPLLNNGQTTRPPIGFWFMASFKDGKKWNVRLPKGEDRGQTQHNYMAALLKTRQAGQPLPPELTNI